MHFGFSQEMYSSSTWRMWVSMLTQCTHNECEDRARTEIPAPALSQGWGRLCSARLCSSAGSRCCCSPSAAGRQLGLLAWLGASWKTVGGDWRVQLHPCSPSCLSGAEAVAAYLEGGPIFLHHSGTGSDSHHETPREHTAVSL